MTDKEIESVKIAHDIEAINKEVESLQKKRSWLRKGVADLVKLLNEKHIENNEDKIKVMLLDISSSEDTTHDYTRGVFLTLQGNFDIEVLESGQDRVWVSSGNLLDLKIEEIRRAIDSLPGAFREMLRRIKERGEKYSQTEEFLKHLIASLS